MKLTEVQIAKIEDLCFDLDWGEIHAVEQVLDILGVYDQIFGKAETE